MRDFQRDDSVLIQQNNQQIKASVAFASKNGNSLWLVFDGMLAGYVQSMPVLRVNGIYRDLVKNEPVELHLLKERMSKEP